MSANTGLVTRTGPTLLPDRSRVLAQLFVPGQENVARTGSRAEGVLARIVALDEEAVSALLADVVARFGDRHRDLPGILERHAAQVVHRLPPDVELSAERRALLGAWFTSEYAVEGAALCNPSVVAHPDQSGTAAGELRFVLSLRAIGEGHISGVEFRTGVLGPTGEVRIDEPGQHVETGVVEPTWHARSSLTDQLRELGADEESARFLVELLPDAFDEAGLAAASAELGSQRVTRKGADATILLVRELLAADYALRFAPESALSERVLWPQTPPEAKGIEDARFVRFVADSGEVSYRATYTAFDGAHIAPHVIETTDFAAFRMSRFTGPAAVNKGMALFPRCIGGHYYALSRWDRENNSLTRSADGLHWGPAAVLHTPSFPWELIQTGNCGSPIETAAGWLVLTHGVGPMREYAIGALLLDLEDPARVLAVLPEPLLTPAQDERDGYVPNVVYSCGALLHGDLLLLPYGVSDGAVRFAVVDVPALLERMLAPAATAANSAS